MLKSIRAAIIGGALGIAALVTTSAIAGGSFTIRNSNSTKGIQQVWFAHAGETTDPWQEADVDEAIGPGSESTFSMSGDNCLYDIKVRFSDGYTQTFSNVNVCHTDSVTAN